ncbi:methyl-accepting chemotaxis protein [Bradyrhizobium diazoefficiens]|nr:methyl-accepting chemotaxis protein [Bradyrhizobium diazoefficiens]MBR0776567.1 methyl-accepting chemotaxis protein [Bradyrhizobium diazoefficiens]
MSRFNIGTRLLLAFVILALAQGVVAVIGLRGMSLSNDDLAEVYHDRLVPVSELARINDLTRGSIEQLAIALISRPSPQNVQKYIDQVNANLAEVERLSADYARHVVGDDEKKLFGEWSSNRQLLINKAIKPAMTDLKAQSFNDAEDTLLGVGVKRFATVQQLMNTILDNEIKRAEATRDSASTRFTIMLYSALAAIAFSLGLSALIALYMNRAVASPIAGMTSAMKRLAGGDLAADIPATGRRDEIGEMAQAVAIFRDGMVDADRLQREQKVEQARKEERQAAIERHITSFEGSVGSALDNLASAATDMRSTSESMSATAAQASEQTARVTTAAEQASGNVEAVAAAAEEMATSVSEIGRQVQDSARIAGTAVDQARKTDERISHLSQAATRIGDVVNLITTIAEQTNLLALNATIEAARAGDAGRGFAVVAQEVKQLASQTAKATSEIGAQITGMQNATQDAVVAIKEIVGTIDKVSEIASAIAAAIEQQGAATQEIARNVQQAARGTEQVSSNITGVNHAATDTDRAANHVLTSADELRGQADTLRLEVDRFLAGIRAACASLARTSAQASSGTQIPPARLERSAASTIATPAKPSSIVG